MMQCVRNFDCLAFNHHLDSATCILLPAAGCMALGSQHGYLYVHLSDCNMVPIREIRRPPLMEDGAGWGQILPEVVTIWSSYLVAPPVMPAVYLSMAFMYYIPGKDLTFRGVSPEHKANMNCPPNPGEFLAFNDTSEYRFDTFHAPSTVPDSAPEISALHDGTPLYVIRKSFTGAPGYDLTGYYNPVSQTNYFVNSGVVSPTNVKILVLNWQLWAWFILDNISENTRLPF